MSKTALVILDMFNTFDFPGAAVLAKHSLPVARNILKLKDRCRKKRVPVIYVNDNFGRWRSDRDQLFRFCSREGSRGREIARILHPHTDDLFVLKPKNSGFFSTTLETLLQHLKVKRIIVTGIAANICVLFTAHDAHMRDYEVIVPEDCTASVRNQDKRNALKLLREFKIETCGSKSLRV